MNTDENLVFAPGRSPRRGGIEAIRGRISYSPLPFAQPRVGMVRASALVPGTHFG